MGAAVKVALFFLTTGGGFFRNSGVLDLGIREFGNLRVHEFRFLGIMNYMFIVGLESAASFALGIGAASFASGANKDIAESPTAEPERPKDGRD